MMQKRCAFIFLLSILLGSPGGAVAGLFEQLALDARSGSLGNSVVSDPQGPISAHYNPAGLDRIRGTEVALGLTWVPVLNFKGKFTQGTDPATGKPWAPFGGFFNNGIDPEAGRTSSTSPSVELPFLGPQPLLVAPNLGIAHHSEHSPIAYGVAVYVPFGAGMDHTDPNDPYRFLGKRMSVLRMVTAPTVSYRVSKSLSVGASVGLGLSSMGFETRMRAPNDLVAMTGTLGQSTGGLEIPVFSELTLPPPWFGGGVSPYEDIGGLKFFAEDNVTTSFNIGVLWEPFSWLGFGGVYQSESKSEMRGKYTMDYSKSLQNMLNWLGSSPTTIIAASMLDLPTSAPPELTGNMSINVVFPARAQLGMKIKPHPRVKFLVDAHWTQWSAWKSMDIVFDREIELLRLARLLGYTGGKRTLSLKNNFKDTWHLSYGLELQPLDALSLRFGYEHRPTSVADDYFGPIPMGDMKLYSAGVGLAMKHPDRKFKGPLGLMKQLLHPDKVDLGFTYMHSEYKVRFNQSKNFNSTNFTDIIYSPFAGLEYEQETTAYFVSLTMTFLW